MPGIGGRLENFGGEIPRASPRLLPKNNASCARNVKLASGELRGIRGLKFLASLPGAVKAYRIPDPLGTDGVTWVGVNSLDINIFRGPLLNDTYDRYYKFGDGVPQYNTLERIRNSDPWFYLGVPAPIDNGSVVAGAGTGAEVTRYYVYTLVSEYGEEGPPSTPITATGPSDATWALTGFSTAATDAAYRNVTKIRIYRTVAAYSITEFFLVTEQAIGLGTYDDTTDDVETSRNAILEACLLYTSPSPRDRS